MRSHCVHPSPSRLQRSQVSAAVLKADFAAAMPYRRTRRWWRRWATRISGSGLTSTGPGFWIQPD
jgi:hypothetical protein